MPYDISDKLKIAVTTRALFQLEAEDKIYEEKGAAEYEAYQIERETVGGSSVCTKRYKC